MSLPRLSSRRPVAVAMFHLAVVLLGALSCARLSVDLLPEVGDPRLVVHTSYPEVAPAEVERLITVPIEAQGAAVPGVERVTSISREGVSLVTLRFARGTDMGFAMLGLRERLDDLRGALPRSALRPTILRLDSEADPVMVLSLAGGADLWQTRELAEAVVRRRLEQLDGVARAAVTGGLRREIGVEVDPERLASYRLSLEEVARALEAANVSAPGGTIRQGRLRYPLRTLGEFRSVEEIGDVAVGRRPTDSVGVRMVRLVDVATVSDGFAEREAITRYNGRESVGILVYEEAGANTVGVDGEVREALAALAREHPGIEVDVVSSQAGFISSSIASVVQALVLGGLLAFLVLLLFLGDSRHPVAVALVIPISVAGTFVLLDAVGVSLNIMSLGGLALGVGMLVDNSIVVLENVFRHRAEEGEGPGEAASAGAEEVQGAITASTLTTIAVFGPIVYVEGVAGELFGDLSLAVAFSLLVSLLAALTLLPAMAARQGGRGVAGPARARAGEAGAADGGGPVDARPSGAGRVRRGARRDLGCGRAFLQELLRFRWERLGGAASRLFRSSAARFDRGFARFGARYHEALVWALGRRGRVLAFSAGALGAAVAVGSLLDRNLLPRVDQGAFRARVELAEGTAIEATARAVGRLESGLLSEPDVEAVFSRIGRDIRSLTEGEGVRGSHTAVVDVRLRPGVSTDRLLKRIRPLARDLPPGAVTFETGPVTALGRFLGGSGADLAVRVRGEDSDAAFAHAERVRERVAEIDGLGNVRVASERGRPELRVEVLPDATARFGIDPRAVVDAVEGALRGVRATEFPDFDRRIPVVVRLPDPLRHSASTLRELRVEGVPLRELVRVRETTGPAEIRREDQSRVVPVRADVVSGGLDRAVAAIEGVLAATPSPEGLRVDVGGENEEMRRSFRDLAFAFGLALLLVYMILAAQFESLVQPLTILVAVPLAVGGSVFALALAGEGLNTMSLIGLVILVGIVVNDAIVKVDFIRQARARGLGVRDAILEAGRVRLRPIVMTTATTVLGLAPMAMGIGRGADLRAPVAIAVIGGLLVATVLTLIVVPVVYSVVEEIGRRAAEGGRRWRGASAGSDRSASS